MTSVTQRELPAPALIAAWCRLWLGRAEPTDVLFQQGHLSQVMGLRLANGVTVVLKLRPPSARLAACVLVQRHLWAAGFPCPEPLAGPAPLGTLSATAEVLMEGGSQLPLTEDSPPLFAEALAVDRAVETLSDPVLEQLLALRPRTALRAVHRREHLEEIEQALRLHS